MNNDMLSGIAFGPVPSRRLGRSLGINNIPPKYCSYSCIYCQLGRNQKLINKRQQFYDPYALVEKINEKIQEVHKNNELIDYLSFVPDGEPTLDINLGITIKLLKKTGIKIAVITNSSMLSDAQAREDLMDADWVSLKVDTVREKTWHVVNRPHKFLDLKTIQNGMIKFARDFNGIKATETMLVNGFNTDKGELKDSADFIMNLNADISYISIPIRPPAEKHAVSPDERCVNMAYQIFSDKIRNVECLTGHEGDDFVRTGNAADDILNISSVHPMREDSIKILLSKAGSDWSVIEELIRENKLLEIKYNSIKFYLRRFNKLV